MSSNEWVRQIQTVKSAGSVDLSSAQRASINEIYMEVIDHGLAQAIEDSIFRFNDEANTLQLFAWLMLQKVIAREFNAIQYYKAIADATRRFPDFIGHLNQIELTSYKNVHIELKAGDDHDLNLGLLLTKALGGHNSSDIESVEAMLPALEEMLSVLNTPNQQINRRVRISSLEAIIGKNPLAERPEHLALRKLVYGEKMTSNLESMEALQTVLQMAAGVARPNSTVMTDAIRRIDLNKEYGKESILADLYYHLPGILQLLGESGSLINSASSTQDTTQCLKLFRKFLDQNGIDSKKVAYSLFTGKPLGMATMIAETHKKGTDFASSIILAVLTDGDDLGGFNSPEGLMGEAWLRSLTLKQCLALDVDDDNRWLKLYSLRGEAELLRKLSKPQSIEKALTIDLGL